MPADCTFPDESRYQAALLARAKFVAKKLAERLETVTQDRKVHGMHSLDHAGWCRNTDKLIQRAKNL